MAQPRTAPRLSASATHSRDGDRQMTAEPAPGTAARRNTRKPATAAQRATVRSAPVHPGQRAAAPALGKQTIDVELPDPIGTVRLPSPQRLAFYGGIATLAVFGIVDWPVALVIGIGHLLAEDHHQRPRRLRRGAHGGLTRFLRHPVSWAGDTMRRCLVIVTFRRSTSYERGWTMASLIERWRWPSAVLRRHGTSWTLDADWLPP